MEEVADRNRSLASRTFETREAQARYNMQMAYTHFLDRALIGKPDAMEYKWITDHIRNDPAYSRMGEYSMTGWMPVPADRHPHMSMGVVSWRDNPYDGYIHYKGAILCERPKEYGEYETKLAEEQTLRDMVGLQMDGLMSEATMPAKVFQNETYRSKGVRTSFKE